MPAGPLEPPEPPEAAAPRRPGGIRVLKVRRQGEGGSKRAVAAFAKLPEAAGAPRPASLGRLHLAGPPRACCGASGPRPRPGLRRPGPRRCPSLTAARQAHAFGQPLPPPSFLPASPGPQSPRWA